LLEVNDQTVPTGIMPVGFPPHPASGLHYRSVVIEVTPQEYEAILRKQLDLPAGWEIRDVYERPAAADRAGNSPGSSSPMLGRGPTRGRLKPTLTHETRSWVPRFRPASICTSCKWLARNRKIVAAAATELGGGS